MEICQRELGAERAAELVAQAGLAATHTLIDIAPDELTWDVGATFPTFHLWAWMWTLLAKQRPEAFLPNARVLRDGYIHALAIAYARRREMAAVRVTLTTTEARRLRALRCWLALATSLPRLRRSTGLIYPAANSLALRHAFTQEWMPQAATGRAYAEVRGLSPQIVVADSLVVGDRRHELVPTILHEEMHVALALTARRGEARVRVPDPDLTRIVFGMEEPAAVLAELVAAHALAADTLPTGQQLRAAALSHEDDRVRAVVGRMPAGAEPGAMVGLAAVCALRARKSTAVQDLLDAVASTLGKPISRDGFEEIFGA